ncbi:short palate, lung and nasal epithelium carcinoma-associated protein 2A-like [Moschus berezovskii]|uniref:short palate, lung and nasal epithelium carcinoma-associated protein 2A-like n=1 Tax=Moschus berezovskii TaxID=68408 RepID=UPI0024445373|nr:short palate, lung and nasal epithelium carcinoma-associated protein 2A-like [Moschus berezovskii]
MWGGENSWITGMVFFELSSRKNGGTTSEEFQEKVQEAENLLEQLISGIFQVVNRLTGVYISHLHNLDITFEVTPDGKGINVRVPITAEVNVTLPVLGEFVGLAFNWVPRYSVSVETDRDRGVSEVVVDERRNDQHSISLTVPGRRIELLNEVVEFVINLANEVLSLVTHCEVNAPLLGLQSQASFLESLDVEYVKKRIVSMRNTSSPSLWSYPYFDLAAFTSKCHRFLLRCRLAAFPL